MSTESASTAAGGASSGASVARPDISFVVPAFNVAPFIGQSIRSALDQTGVSVEVIVVDDASTDGTGDIVAALAATDSRIVLLRRLVNGGLSVARNQAIERARGIWLAILDGDDWIMPRRSRDLIDLASSFGAEIAADNYERVSEDGTPLGSSMIPKAAVPFAFLVGLSDFVAGNITFRKGSWTLGAIKPIVRSDFFKRAQLRYDEDPLLRNEDFLLYVRLLLAGGRFVVTSQSYYQYRLRSGSNSFRIGSAHTAAMVRANGELGLARLFDTSSETGRIVARYDWALARGHRFVQLVEAAKSDQWRTVLREALIHPSLWPMMVRFGWEAASRRLEPLRRRTARLHRNGIVPARSRAQGVE